MSSFSRFSSTFLLFFTVASVTLPGIVSANADQRCFTKQECTDARKVIVGDNEEATKGFYDKPDAQAVCGKTKKIGEADVPVGFCLPAGKTTTQISFGGRTEFANLGEFIQYGYRYGIMLAGVLAAIMIIIAGFQWATSGGNSSTIEEAKHRISGAVIGLIIAVLSYTILNTVNPNLVNLRLPQVWLLKKATIQDEFCSELPTNEKVARLGPVGEKLSPKDKGDRQKNAEFTIEPKLAKCGDDFFFSSGGGLTCEGNFCNEGQVCLQHDDKLPPKCELGSLGGNISANAQIFCNDLQTGRIIDNNLKLIAICSDGDLEEVKDIDVPAPGRVFVFSNIQDTVERVCDGNPIGFYFGAEVNDESSGAGGQICPGMAGSGGNDDWFAIGKTPNSHFCNVNLAQQATAIITGSRSDCDGDNGNDFCSCGAISDPDTLKYVKDNEDFTNFLIKKEDLLRGFRCDINISRNEFPRLTNDIVAVSLLTATYDECKIYNHAPIDSPLTDILQGE